MSHSDTLTVFKLALNNAITKSLACYKRREGDVYRYTTRLDEIGIGQPTVAVVDAIIALCAKRKVVCIYDDIHRTFVYTVDITTVSLGIEDVHQV